MKFLKLLWLYIKLPYILYKNAYKPVYKANLTNFENFGHYMKVKEQRSESTRLNMVLSRSKPICESRLLRYDCLNVIATHREDYDELLKAIEQLLSTAIRIYVRVDKLEPEEEPQEEVQEEKVEEVLVEETEEE